VAVADILDADLGWVIVFGFAVGIPTAIITGPLFGKYIAKRIHAIAPSSFKNVGDDLPKPPVAMVLTIIGLPILLIVFNTVLNSPMGESWVNDTVKNWMGMIGHPFTALILANLIAWYVLGVRRKAAKSTLLEVSAKSMAPAGIIILVTGAGGVFKEMLITTGIGNMLAEYFAGVGLSILFFAFIVAALVRILQGSATVSMITAAGVTAPLLSDTGSDIEKALLVIAIASGATILSHVNDSGFWLVSKYLGLSEKQTFMSWTVMTTVLALISIMIVFFISLFLK
jgi:Gnt-I system low-affinity gluconate transporter